MKKAAIESLLTLSLILSFTIPAIAADIGLSVAASLREVVTELSDGFAKRHPGMRFQTNFGGSGALAKQIENGAPTDIFISANLEWMDYLKERRLLDEKSVSTFAYNVLVFVGRPGPKTSGMQDVVKLDKIAIGSPKSVPAGEYAMEAFKKAGINKQLENKLIMARDVRECLLYADRGEVDGAFVYKTDAQEMARNVKILFTIPQDLYPRVTYPMALTTGGSNKPEAVAFFRFLQSGEARTVLGKHGFVLK